MKGVNIIGMPYGMHGLGLELRDKALALQSAGVEVCILNENYSSLKRTIHNEHIHSLIATKPRYDVNLFCHNLPAIGLIAKKYPELFKGRYNIGAPYWEFPQLPDSHQSIIDKLDEVWVSNSFLKEIFSSYTDKQVVQMPLHLDVSDTDSSRDRQEGRPLVFGYVFDFNSMAARKDPMILLTSFLESFSSKSTENVKLKIKYNFEPSKLVRPRDIKDFLALAEMDQRIELTDKPLSNQEMNELTDSFDVFVSPHRAEGLGRSIVEAMMKGKAVVATDYSGPAEFLSPDCTYPLRHFDSHVGSAAIGDIKSNFTWVDVCEDSLSRSMRRIYENPEEASLKGKQASKFICKSHGRKQHGNACKNRLADLA